MLIAAHFLNGFLMVAMPLALGVFLARKLRQSWALFGVGMATFAGSQVVHLPFNAWVLNPLLELGERGVTLFAAALLGLSAGVFEGVARYLALRFWRREARSWRGALMLGTGHGGIEAMLFGVLVLLTFFQALAYRDVNLATLVPADQVELAQEQLAAYWGVTWPQALLGAAERLFALCLHLSLSVMVMRAFTQRNRLWLAAALAWHAIVDGLVVASVPVIGPVNTEFVIGGLAIISVAIVFLLREESGDTEDMASLSTSVPSDPGPAFTVHEQERVDDSRYVET